MTDLETPTQYILKTIRCQCKIGCYVADAEAEKNCSELMVLFLFNKQSKETLKLLINFQMIRKSSLIMD